MTKEEKKHWQGVGFHFAWGVMLAVWLIAVTAFGISYLVNGLLRATDDCDRSSWDRCGMRVLTDAKTGQQYLVTTGGGIVPRAPSR